MRRDLSLRYFPIVFFSGLIHCAGESSSISVRIRDDGRHRDSVDVMDAVGSFDEAHVAIAGNVREVVDPAAWPLNRETVDRGC